MVLSDSDNLSVTRLPDIDEVDASGWCRRSFPIRGQGNRNVVQVVVKRSVLDAVGAHGASRTDVEVCGVLVGNCYQDERGPFIYVEAIVPGEHADNQAAQVTFTSETWNHIQDQMEQHYGGLRILGWYHTHPGFGIFLSPMDLFIHENFFNESDQLALVYDPLKDEDGLFVWHGGQAQPYSYLVEEDVTTDGKFREQRQTSSKPQLTAGAGTESGQRLLRLERRSRRLGWGVTAIAVFAVVWPILLARLDLATFLQARLFTAEPRKASESRPALPEGNSPALPLPQPQPPVDHAMKRNEQSTSSQEADAPPPIRRDNGERETENADADFQNQPK